MDHSELLVGDMVLFHSNPFTPDKSQAAMGWVSTRPGNNTVNILIWAQNAGFVEKPSVRHIDDPFWRESETAAAWGKWGAYELHPNTKALKEMQAVLTRAKIDAAKKVKGE
jgi:hypothetical protein